MAIPESQLETWSHQGSIKQSSYTYEVVSAALKDPAAPFANRDFDVYLQGSYGNSTNIYGDSDVDLVICLTSTFYSDIGSLSDIEKEKYEQNRSPANYGISEFRQEVLSWLTKKYGAGVKDGNKALTIPANGSRREADVLPCAQHRRYSSYTNIIQAAYHTGIVFWTKENEKIINFPKQHLSNCTTKHQQTLSRFKPNVRVIKNMRLEAVRRDLLSKKNSPSYFLEGMLSNVPNENFVNSKSSTFVNYWNWLDNCNTKELTCANDLHWLLRDGHTVCWNEKDFKQTLSALSVLWTKW